MRKASHGFTLIELLIVIAIIGVISTIGVVVYNGVMRNTRNSQRETQMSAISNALEKYYDDNSEYPSCSDMSSRTSGQILGIDQSLFISPGSDPDDDNSFTDNCESFSEDGSYDEFVYDGDGCTDEACLEYDLNYYEEGNDEGWIDLPSDEIMTPDEVANLLDCPSGFIKVPGSRTYRTTAFCAMKYEAKNVNGIAISQPEGVPWASISQADAKRVAKEACDGCHLMTESEWMTIAADVLIVPTNWSESSFGVGNIFRGNCTNANYLSADGSFYSIERRTLTLSTGDDIWDFSGNVSEWTQATIMAKDQPGLSTDLANETTTKEWSNPELILDGLPSLSAPPLEAKSLTSANGIGNLSSSYNYNGNNSTLVFSRGGYSGSGLSQSGIYALSFTNAGIKLPQTGFRAAR